MQEHKAWQNPFEKNLLEDWRLDRFPQHYREVIACFFPPDFMDKIESTDVKPKILMGGGGAGKSHILTMLSVQSAINEARLRKAELLARTSAEVPLSLADWEAHYFGVYLKSTLFSPFAASNITFLEPAQLKFVFEHVFNIQVCIAVMDGLVFASRSFVDFPVTAEVNICSRLTETLGNIIQGTTFSSVLGCLTGQIDSVRTFIREFAFEKNFSKFKSQVKLTSAPDFIESVFTVLSEEVFPEKVLFILLDEYDELDEYQQKFINSLIRTRKLAFRIASKIGGIKTTEYADGNNLDEIHDYDPIISLHFESFGEKPTSYKNLSRNIFIKRLKVYGNYLDQQPEDLLPKPTLEDEKVTQVEVDGELADIQDSLKQKRTEKDSDEYWKTFQGHYREAAIYRVLRKKGRDRLYAGFDKYVTLSAGIVRQLILLCKEAFLMAHQRGIQLEGGTAIPVRIQSEAAEKVSRDLLLVDTIKSTPSTFGPKLVRLIEDLGRILQAKLYYSTEPQANNFEVVDSQKLTKPEYEMPRQILDAGFKLPHFITEKAFKPKQQEYSQSWSGKTGQWLKWCELLYTNDSIGKESSNHDKETEKEPRSSVQGEGGS